MGFFWQKKVLKHLELIILMKSITTAMEKKEKKKKSRTNYRTLYQNVRIMITALLRSQLSASFPLL